LPQRSGKKALGDLVSFEDNSKFFTMPSLSHKQVFGFPQPAPAAFDYHYLRANARIASFFSTIFSAHPIL
jgi:hypothetical protein